MKNMLVKYELASFSPYGRATTFALFVFINIVTLANAADYRQIKKFEETIDDLAQADENSLIIFDVDNVLIAGLSAINRPVGDPVRDNLREQYTGNLSLEENLELQSLVWLHGKFCLIESGIPSLIQELQQKGIPTIALSALGTGTFGLISNLMDFRIDQLQQMSIDFSHSSPKGHYVFTDLIEAYGSYPAYKNGVLLSNWYKNNKGDVLLAFLKKIDWLPNKVIFFDDSLRNLISVKEKLSDLPIEFVGFHYTAECFITDRLDLEIAHKQFDYLVQQRHWLDDAEIVEKSNSLYQEALR